MLSPRLHCVPDCFSFIPEADHGSTLLLYCVCGLVLSMKAWFGLRMAGRTMTSVANTGRHVFKHRCCSSVHFTVFWSWFSAQGSIRGRCDVCYAMSIPFDGIWYRLFPSAIDHHLREMFLIWCFTFSSNISHSHLISLFFI
jgi:hypothetical protein